MFHSIFKRLFAEIIERTKCSIQQFKTNQTFSGLVLFVFTLCQVLCQHSKMQKTKETQSLFQKGAMSALSPWPEAVLFSSTTKLTPVIINESCKNLFGKKKSPQNENTFICGSSLFFPLLPHNLVIQTPARMRVAGQESKNFWRLEIEIDHMEACRHVGTWAITLNGMVNHERV